MSVEFPSGVPFVDVTRGERVESVHHIAACCTDAHGRISFALGDVETPIFLRSAAKPFIAAAVVAAGAVDRFGITTEELAVMCASHDGEPFHVEAARSILAKSDLDAGYLLCGTHAPYDALSARALHDAGEEPSALHSNCSGKHAGILALCKLLGADYATYLEPTHPAQQAILATCARATGDPQQSERLGVDGCGIPVFATSLRHGATAFARLATLDGLSDADASAFARVRDAMLAHPAFVAGTRRFDTALMLAARGNLVSKGGAEGVHGDGILESGSGFMLKVIDGTRRATAPAVVTLLRYLSAIEDDAVAQLAPYAQPDVTNVAGRVVGGIRARAPVSIA